MEIERKYLVDKINFDLQPFKRYEIMQAYISVDPVIRIRKRDMEFYLTIKCDSDEIADLLYSRNEFEVRISEKQFDQLLQKSENNKIYKTRYLIPVHDNYMAELDVYYKDLDGLITVEVEFESEGKAIDFKAPVWFGEDVSLDKNYSNASLSTYGIPK